MSDESENQWMNACLCDYAFTDKRLPLESMGNAATHREAWLAWSKEYSDFFGSKEDLSYLRRAAHSWVAISDWLKKNAPPMHATLMPGVKREEMEKFEGGGTLPSALKAIYRIHNGQDPRRAAIDIARDDSTFFGLFGGYNFYDHVINLRMLSLEVGLNLAEQQAASFSWEETVPDRPFVIACSLRMPDTSGQSRIPKMLVVNNKTAKIWLRGHDSRLMRACKNTDVSDGVLKWFEDFAARVAAQNFEFKPIVPAAPLLGLSLYPRCPPTGGEATTQSIRIRGSSIFVPEKTRINYWFTYCFRMSAVAALPAEWGGTCQLVTRHLVFSDSISESPNIVDGEGVIGDFPILKFGRHQRSTGQPEQEGEYEYASCTGVDSDLGEVSGSFRFVPGTIKAPKGPPFDVKIPNIKLIVPDYIS
uniref:ApaG domain-containing protein n=1 Tax=Guillardia theta TaxID=55529 RepID=A0A7S4KF13_GUITH